MLNGDGADGGAAVRGMSSDGRGKSEKTISAKESMLAERCSALLSLRLQVRKIERERERRSEKESTKSRSSQRPQQQVEGAAAGFVASAKQTWPTNAITSTSRYPGHFNGH